MRAKLKKKVVHYNCWNGNKNAEKELNEKLDGYETYDGFQHVCYSLIYKMNVNNDNAYVAIRIWEAFLVYKFANTSLYTTLIVVFFGVPSLSWIRICSHFLLCTHESATYSWAWENTGFGKYNPTCAKDCPWDLLSYPNFVREPLLDDVRPFFGPREVLGTHH